MLVCMRTTLVIPDEIFRLAKKKAQEEGRTLSGIVADALRRALLPRLRPKGAFVLKCRTFKGKVLPGVDLADRDSLYDRMEGRS